MSRTPGGVVAATVSAARTSPGPASRAASRRSSAGATVPPRRPRATRGARGARAPSSRGTRHDAAGRQRGRLGPHGAADEHAARPGAAGDADLALEGRVVDATRQQHPGEGSGRVELRARVRPAGLVRHAGIVRKLDLEHVRTRRRQATCRLDDDLAARLARQPAAVEAERERLEEQREIRAPGTPRATSATSRSWSAAFGASGVVVDEELRGRGAKALDAVDAPARQHAADAGARRTLVARGLDGDDQARPARERAVGDRRARRRSRGRAGRRSPSCPAHARRRA